MNLRIRKLIYEYSKNSRIKTKELGKKLKISQQSASYLLSSLKKKKILKEPTMIIDPAKFGYINIFVYYNFTDLSAKAIQETISALLQIDDVVFLQRLEQGFDLAVIYCVPNLSHFNKVQKEFQQKYRHFLYVSAVYPVIVQHFYPKKYLVTQKKPEEIIISGDRDPLQLTENQRRILSVLYENPTSTIVDISTKLLLNPKTVINIKSQLETRRIIRGYSTLWSYPKLKIVKKQILFSSEHLNREEDKKILEFAKMHPYIIGLTKLIGTFDLLVEVEGDNFSSRDVLREIRSEFAIKDYKMIIVDDVLKAGYIPQSSFTSSK